MNKSELITALTKKLGSRKAAVQAVDAVLREIVSAVDKGESVSIRGFGSFEKTSGTARTARTRVQVHVQEGMATPKGKSRTSRTGRTSASVARSKTIRKQSIGGGTRGSARTGSGGGRSNKFIDPGNGGPNYK